MARSKVAAGGNGRTLVADASTIELLSSPVRQELVDALEARGGESAVAALATDLARKPDALYYHLRLLVEGGLVEEVPGRSAAGRDERRYRLTRPQGAPLMLSYRALPSAEARRKSTARAAPKTPARHTRAVNGAVASMLRNASRDFGAALANAATVTDGDARELWASRARGWLSDAELAEANQLLRRLNQLMLTPRKPGRDRLMSFCFVFAKLGEGE